MRFEALELSLDVIRSLRGVLPRIQRQDRDLARQIRRAVSSVALNLGEGNRRQGGDRKHLWRIAAGSAEEVRTALRVAEAWGFVSGRTISRALERIDRLLGMLWSLTR